ncbi:TPA: hypothetical protein I7730_15895 [Vibrio vulnificus]|uniref:Uncharacterized protein n=1 Tax=Vibrio vulnificus TaxID=672 RepID=A0A8H9N1U8_VIBVL|nr:hypothetical protein [Vibrio vulnificus]HAS8541265.1 hypothetical protein [Vibrio vulnificus]
MKKVSVSEFAKDHWALLAYVEDLCVNSPKGIGSIDKRRMRCNPNRHPNESAKYQWKDEYGSRIVGGKVVLGHDDWDCLDELEANGFVEIVSMANLTVKMTDRGNDVTAMVRSHKAAGGNYADFSLQSQMG